MNKDILNLKQLVNNLLISVNTISSSFQNIQKIYLVSNNNLNVEHNNYNECYKYIDDLIEDLKKFNDIKNINNDIIKLYVDLVDDKIRTLINDNNEFNKMINEKLNNIKNNNNNPIDNSVNDLIIKNNLYINDRFDNMTDRIDNIEFNNNNGLRTDEIHKIKTLIYSEDDTYLKDEIKNVKSDYNLLRNKIINNWEDVIDITKNILNLLNEYKIKYELLKNSNEDIKSLISLISSLNYDDEIQLLKQDNILIKDYIEEVKLKLNNDKEYQQIKANNAILKDEIDKLKQGVKIILGKLK